MKIESNYNVNKVEMKKAEKAEEKANVAAQSYNQISDLKGMDAVGGASQVKHVMHVAPGSPILDKAAPVISKPVPATLHVATEPGTVTDVWSGREVPYSKGDIVMYYGEQQFDWGVHPDVVDKCVAEGLETAPDWNRSVEPDLMRETYVDEATGKYLIETGQLEAGKAPVKAIKKAKGGCLILPAGTKVHSLETIQNNLEPVTVLPGQVTALDHKSNPYVQDISVMVKKNIPTTPEGEKLFNEMKEFVAYRKELQEKYGANTPEYDKQLAGAWAEFVKSVN